MLQYKVVSSAYINISNTLLTRGKSLTGADWTVGKSVIYRIKFTTKKNEKEKMKKKKKKKEKRRNKRKNIKKENSLGKTKTHRLKRASDLCVESD